LWFLRTQESQPGVAIPSKWGLLSDRKLYLTKNFQKSQSLLNEVFFPTTNQTCLRVWKKKVAIPSKWGLLSDWLPVDKFMEKMEVAIPSKWGLLSDWRFRKYLRGKALSQSLLNEVFFPTMFKSWEFLKEYGSQSLLNEVFFPTTPNGAKFFDHLKS